MDRGFYSASNINDLLKERYKFLIGVKTSLKFVKQHLNQVYDELATFENLNASDDTYSMAVLCYWNYQYENRKGGIIKSKRRVYLYLYYNIDKATEEKKSFDRKVMTCFEELSTGKRQSKNDTFYKNFFSVKKTPKRGIQVSINQQAIDEAKRYHGYFALLSNEKMKAVDALQLYRSKDSIEKAFGNIKERLNMRRTLVSSVQSLDGKLFVCFIALTLTSYIKKQMQQADLFNKYTMQSFFDTLDVIELFQTQGQNTQVGEILQKQRDLFIAMDVPIPS